MAVRVPESVGVKTIVAVQLAEAARVEPQVLELMEKSPELVPVIFVPLNVMELEVLLVRVTDCELLVDPTCVLLKDRLPGAAVTLPDAPPVPRPVTETCCGLLPALSVKVRVAVRVPEAVGLKRIVMVQLADAASVEPQVF